MLSAFFMYINKGNCVPSNPLELPESAKDCPFTEPNPNLATAIHFFKPKNLVNSSP